MKAIIKIDQVVKNGRCSATAQVELRNEDQRGLFHYITIGDTKILEVSVENEQEAVQYFLKELSDAEIDPREIATYTIKGDLPNTVEVFEQIAELELKYRKRNYDPNLDIKLIK